MPWTVATFVWAVLITFLALLGIVGPGCVDDTPTGVEGVFADGAFVGELIQARTFTDGTAVTTVTYPNGTDRTPFGVDFNRDGKVDPVVTYGDDQGVIQILLSAGPAGTVAFVPLSLDSKRDMQDLADVAVGDIDGDNRLDIVAAASEALWYWRQPEEGPTYLRGWGNTDEEDSLHEKIDASVTALDEAALQAIIKQAIGALVNIEDYIVTVESRFTDVEIGDMDNDGWNDIVASRLFRISLEPRPGLAVEPIDINDGDVIIFLNPGAATDGREWSPISVGRHERQLRLDRDGASGLMLYDLDADNDLDIVSAAQADNNVQVAWFENPVPAGTSLLSPEVAWKQWRIGSVRSAWAIDIADVTNDGLVDVIASGPEQQQVMLFAQPGRGPKREFDWDSTPLITFINYQPHDVKAMDIDGDGRMEVVVGCNEGAVRYFEWPGNASDEWNPYMVADFDPPGDVGLLGYGDLDADGDVDLVTVIAGTEPNDSRISWIRNDLAR